MRWSDRTLCVSLFISSRRGSTNTFFEKKRSCFLTCFGLLYLLGQMVLLNDQLEGSGPEGKRACPPLAPQWSPLPQFPLAGLAFLMVIQKKKKRRVSQVRNDEVLNPPRAFVSIAAHLTLASMLQFPWSNWEVSLQPVRNTSSHWPGNLHSSQCVPGQVPSFY